MKSNRQFLDCRGMIPFAAASLLNNASWYAVCLRALLPIASPSRRPLIGFRPMEAASHSGKRCYHRDKLGGERAAESFECSCQLLPPSGQARMEGTASKSIETRWTGLAPAIRTFGVLETTCPEHPRWCRHFGKASGP
jgi:hypothetical protein